MIWAAALAAIGTAGLAAEPPGRSDVKVSGCLQRLSADPQTGTKVPSGFALMNAGDTPFGGSAGPDSTEDLAARAGAAAEHPSQDAGHPPEFGQKAGGSGLRSGIKYFLEGGSDLQQHVGQRVEVLGTLLQATATPPQTSGAGRSSSPASEPQRLRVRAIRTIAKSCGPV